MPQQTANTARQSSPSLELLRRVLIGKVVVTVLLWAGPFLLFPRTFLLELMGQVPADIFLLRLLGWAYVALTAGYISGFIVAGQGRMPWGIVIMGLVSNGGAAVLLGFYLLIGAGLDLTGLPLLMNWSSWVALAAITLALLLSIRRHREI